MKQDYDIYTIVQEVMGLSTLHYSVNIFTLINEPVNPSEPLKFRKDAFSKKGYLFNPHKIWPEN